MCALSSGIDRGISVYSLPFLEPRYLRARLCCSRFLTILREMSDALEPLSGTGVPSSKLKLGVIYETPLVVKSDLHGPKEVSKVTEVLLRQHFKCSTNRHQDDFVDEGYYSPSPTPTESEIEFSSGAAKYTREVKEAPLTPQFAINDILLELPQIHVTDENGAIEIIAPDDDEHGQFWNFARDKIARRMFFIRADRRTQHMESTFYSDLYPVRQHLNLLQMEKCLTLVGYSLITDHS